MGRVVLRAGADTWANAEKPTLAYPDSAILRVHRDTARAFLHFSVASAFPDGATITRATLRFYTYALPAATRTLTVRRVGKRPLYSRLTWANQPEGITGPGEPRSVTKTGALEGAHLWEVDVTSHVQAVSDGALWQGWRIESDTAERIQIYSSESTRRPYLEIEYSEAPEAPSRLAPGDGRAVGTPKPTLTFDFVDVVGDTTLTQIQVQISETESFAAPLWDSGQIPASKPELALAGTTFPGIPVDSSVWWRVRVADAALWSDWSSPEEVRYRARGALVVVSPAPGSPVISDPTLPVVWSLVGRAQSAYQVIVALSSDPSRWLWTSGKVTSTDQSVTIPDKVLRYDDRSYAITVRVWDTLDRVSSAGDLARYEAQVVARFDDDATAAPVEWLTAAALGTSPDVELRWGRSSAADKWMILRNSEIIASVLPEDTATDEAGTYRWVDRTAPGRVEHRYQVRAIVNGKTAAGNPVATAQTHPAGAWLSTLDGSTRVVIMNVPEPDWAMDEQSEKISIRGATTPVLITQSLGGYSGTLAGDLVTDAGSELQGITAQDHRAALLKIKATPGQRLRLAIGDVNIPVVAFNIVPQPMKDEYARRIPCSLEFFQDGEPIFEDA